MSYFKRLFGAFRRKHKKSTTTGFTRLSTLPIIQQFAAFASMTAGKVMFPRNEIIGIDKEANIEEIVKLFTKFQVMSVVVYEQSLDQVVGQVKIHDIMGLELGSKTAKQSWHHLITPIILVTENTSLIELSLKLHYAHDPIALVVDEYGGIDGIISQGYINKILCRKISKQNRHDILITKMSDNVFQIPARMRINEFEEALELKIADKISQNCETMGGLVMVLAGKVPKAGEKILFKAANIELTVLEADLSRIKRLAIKLISS